MTAEICAWELLLFCGLFCPQFSVAFCSLIFDFCFICIFVKFVAFLEIFHFLYILNIFEDF